MNLRTGKTHKGKASMGRPVGRLSEGRQVDPVEVVTWRKANKASITATGAKFGLSASTVKRYCAA